MSNVSSWSLIDSSKGKQNHGCYGFINIQGH